MAEGKESRGGCVVAIIAGRTHPLLEFVDDTCSVLADDANAGYSSYKSVFEVAPNVADESDSDGEESLGCQEPIRLLFRRFVAA